MKIKKYIQKYGKKHERILLLLVCFLALIIPYFAINNHTSNAEINGKEAYTISTLIDNIIPFIPIFIFGYIGYYILFVLPYFLVKDAKLYRKTMIGYLIILFVSFLIFLVYPVKMIRPEIISDGILHQIVQFFYSIDLPYNTFPSIHVSLSFLSGFACFQQNRKYWWVVLWVVVIGVSTMFVKQHYFADVAGGLMLSLVVYFYLFLSKK